jgi:hypothetical protein
MGAFLKAAYGISQHGDQQAIFTLLGRRLPAHGREER